MRMLCRSHIPLEPSLEMHIVPALRNAVKQNTLPRSQDDKNAMSREDMRSCCEGNRAARAPNIGLRKHDITVGYVVCTSLYLFGMG